MCSVVTACGLSCPVACGILVPRPGIEPASPALEGGFLTTGPPGKSPGKEFFKFTYGLLVFEASISVRVVCQSVLSLTPCHIYLREIKELANIDRFSERTRTLYDTSCVTEVFVFLWAWRDLVATWSCLLWKNPCSSVTGPVWTSPLDSPFQLDASHGRCSARTF